MIFSVTARGTFKRCKRQSVLTDKNGMHLGPSFGPLHLAVGSMVHKASQTWLDDWAKNGAANKGARFHGMRAALGAAELAERQYEARVGVRPSSEEVETTNEAVDFAVCMMANYEEHWTTPLSKEYILIAPEQRVRIPVPGTTHQCPNCVRGRRWVTMRLDTGQTDVAEVICTTCNGAGEEVHYLEGRLDALIRRKDNGRLDILEHKSYKSRPKQEDLLRTDQFDAYRWQVGQLGLGDPYETHIAYDGLWRRKETPRGKRFSDLFSRYLLPPSKEALKEFERFLPMELNDMAALFRHPAPLDAAYTNRRWEGCWDCGVRKVCNAMTDNTGYEAIIDAGFVKRTDDVEPTEDESDDAL